MKNNILILNGSMRKNGNTARLVQSFADGAAKNNNVEIVSVADYNVNPCIGCNQHAMFLSLIISITSSSRYLTSVMKSLLLMKIMEPLNVVMTGF